MCRNFSFFWKVTRDYTLFTVIQISLQFRRNFNHQVSLKSSKFSVSFFRYREQENSNFQLKYWFTLDVIPKFYHETFLRSIWIEVHRGSMDEKAEKNENMKSSELQPGRELLMRLSLLSTHRAYWFYL